MFFFDFFLKVTEREIKFRVLQSFTEFTESIYKECIEPDSNRRGAFARRVNLCYILLEEE